jgi:capsular exopolysaccharide synthesis family protein
MTAPIDPKKPRSNGSADKAIRHEPAMAEYFPIIMRGKWIVFLSLIAATGVSAIYTFMAKPVYESSARVLIDMQGSKGSMPFSFDVSGTAAINKITNELEILKSQSLMQTVAQALLERKTLAPGGKEFISIIQMVSEGESLRVIAPPTEIMERLEKAVDFTPIRESDIIKISARSNDPREAALIANVYAESYVERNVNASRNRSRSVREFLQSQREAKKKVLDSAETSLQRYMQTSGTVALDDETKKVVEQLSQLEANRDAIAVEISSRQKTLDSYKSELARQEPAVARSIGESNDAYVRLLQEQLANLEVQRDVIIAQNPSLMGRKIYDDKLKEINEQITSLKARLQSRTSQFLKSIVPSAAGEGSAGYLAQTRQKVIEQQIELDGLAARERALSAVISSYEDQFGRIPQKSIDLARHQRARLSSEKLYLLVEEKFNEASITEKSEFGYVDIVDPAIVLIKPVSPKVLLNLIVGVVLGLGLGLLIVVVRERMDTRIWTAGDLKRFGFASIATISRMVEERGKDGKASAKPGGKSFDPHLVAYHSPLSFLAESYRLLRTNVQYADLERPLKSVMVTSANPSEGKSTSVANLALAFSQAEKKVLLVDADMRRPSLHRFFNLRRSPGLTEYVSGNSDLDEVVQKNVVKNLDMICSGTAPANPAEVSGSHGMRAFIKLATQIYDIVLFDSAPVLAVTDAAAFAREVDGTVLVVSSGDTAGPEIERAMEALNTVGAKVLGVVLNNFDPTRAYGGNYGPYRRSRYGYRYSDYIESGSGNGGRKRRTARE